MKVIILISMILGTILLNTSNLKAQEANSAKDNISTATITVSGNCGHCKARIETAAKSAKAQKASWNADDQKLTVSFDPAVTNLEKIEKKVAAAGHDTELVKATNGKYKSLPGCCQYDRMAETKK